MRSRAVRGPKEGTGALNQVGSRRRQSARNALRRGQREQFRPGLPDSPVIGSGSIVEVVIVGSAGAGPLRSSGSLQELWCMPLARLARLARLAGGALGRVAADLGLQFDNVEE